MKLRRIRRKKAYSATRHVLLAMAAHPCWLGPGQWDHDWKFVSDWYGDPDVINGTADCSYDECRICHAQDHQAEPPDYDSDYYF